MSLPIRRVYYVRFKSERNGPHTAQDVIDMLRNREISMLHQVSDGQRCWNMDAFIEALEGPARDDKSSGSKQADIPRNREDVHMRGHPASGRPSPLGKCNQTGDGPDPDAGLGKPVGEGESHITEPGETPSVKNPQAVTDRYAVAAFGFMCLGFLLGALSAIPAVYLGHLALGSIQAHAGRKGMGLALAALVIGYAQIALSIILLILFLILF